MRRLLACLTASLLAVPAAAQTPPAASAQVQAAPEFATRAQELLGILAGTGDYAAFFSPAFQAAVPRERFAPVNVQLTAANGAPVALEGISLDTPYAGLVRIRYEKAIVAFQMVVDPAPPHQVTGLRPLGPVASEKTLGDVAAALDALPGASGYAFAKLGGSGPALTLQHNASKPFAVGSAFKLVILAELVRSTNAGERTWDDMVTLDGRMLPGGGYALKPAGTKVSLRELATQMISISDNSATDILLATLGRERVEAMLPVLGVRPDPRNIPYLATLEAFKLKWLDGGRLGDRYIGLDDAGQRKMLGSEVLAADITPLMAMKTPPTTPSRIDTLEWFFAPADQIRVMDWLRRNTEGAKGADARAVLSKNSGIAIDKAQYGWVGFKGGSEPGVMNLTFLLQGSDGNWYAAAASWNDTSKPVDEARFAGLMSALLKFAGPQK
jgi:beta-lactamase class A